MEKVKSALGMDEGNESIFGILKMEHKQVKDNLQQILDQNSPMMDLFSQTLNALTLHMAGEERLLYPKLKENAATRQMAYAAYEEHNMGKQLASQMTSVPTDNDQWLARVKVLRDLISNHVDMEENKMFPAAKDLLSDDQEKELARQYLSQKTANLNSRL